MGRYFKITEIDREEYVTATGEDSSSYCQVVIPVDQAVYVAISEDEDELQVPLDSFEGDW